MKKLLLLLSIATIFTISLNAQHNPFKPIHVDKTYKVSLGATSATDSVFNAWRFGFNVAGYTLPDKLLISGIAFGFNHIDYNFASQKATTQWSLNFVMWATGATAPTNPSSAESFGIDFGFLKDILHLGVLYNPGLGKAQVEGGVGIALN